MNRRKKHEKRQRTQLPLPQPANESACKGGQGQSKGKAKTAARAPKPIKGRQSLRRRNDGSAPSEPRAVPPRDVMFINRQRLCARLHVGQPVRGARKGTQGSARAENGELLTRLPTSGTIIYIHPAAHYVTVHFKVAFGAYNESFPPEEIFKLKS